ncbi:MAG: hypothetical protein IH594_15855 [Bacteroidales bacterium]|nr:hypothetical protein [Bacteroidales bacterium]
MQKINPSGCLIHTNEVKNHTPLMIAGKRKVLVKNQEKLRKYLSFWLSLILALTMSACHQSTSWSPDPREFNQPGSPSAIHAWWHWVDNAITREGITADLEAMKKAGIVSATILNVSLFQEKDLGVSPVIFNSPEWYGMFRWALEEANRLSLTLGVHNCDGWSTSGGPWITPELSMKKCVWTKTYASGGAKLELQLPEPHGEMNFYRDISVLAYPASRLPGQFATMIPELFLNGSPSGNLLFDGNPHSSVPISGPTLIDIHCPGPLTVSGLAIHPRKEFQWGNDSIINAKITLQASNGIPAYTNLLTSDTIHLNRTNILSFPEITIEKFRLSISTPDGNNRFVPFDLSELELLAKGELPSYHTDIPFHLEKTATTKAVKLEHIFKPFAENLVGVNPDEVTDLSTRMDSAGLLSWDAPAGDWVILRIGYTTTSAVNAPATEAGRGLECDKMDTAALNYHFSQLPEKLTATAAEFTGNTFEYLFVDSWECKYQNWTKNFADEFQERCGYSILPWLPVLSGEVVGNAEDTERFLQDFRKTIAELTEFNYYEHFNTLCHRLGLRSHAEVIYGGTGYPPLDVIRTNQYVDVPMWEFWAGVEPVTGLIGYQPVRHAVSDLPMHAANLYGKKVVPAEAYTGFANYSETPWDLKLFGDRAFCSGVNQMVLHSYVHQPDNRKPGFTLGIFGQSFNRHNPWWPYVSQWFDYHARIQYMLQNAVTQADLLCYTGDRYYDLWTAEWEQQLPPGFAIQKCNLDILKNHCRIKDGNIVLDNGTSFPLLLLPEDEQMNLQTLEVIAGLVKQGATISGPKPLRTLSLQQAAANDEVLRTLADKLWGQPGTDGKYRNNFGKGKVYGGYSFEEVREMEDIQPAFNYNENEGLPLLTIRKKSGNHDFWFVVNQEDREVNRSCILNAPAGDLQVWDPQYGTVSKLSPNKVEGGATEIRVSFGPKSSLFFVSGMAEDPSLPVYSKPLNTWTVSEFNGTLSFEALPGKETLQVNEYSSYDQSEDPAIKYYSGQAGYTIHFTLPDSVALKDHLLMTPGAVADGYTLSLNGQEIGSAVFPGYYFPVSGIARPGDNTMMVKVGNSFRNRIIGDRTQNGTLNDLWTTSPYGRLPEPGMPLKQAGLMGPVVFAW